ncbi:hypothetical protein SAICODRAFT_63359 [Saitoella complicata NRRL Y-17804]|nr:uncharacterized protein SAICODRAFT_63359 [Saitoella complicata NRRL Y-17804]ODQ56306.1 hypothetical protein SAICODRAFT_63359 [Saitoella complicata NRRL Y-17804]
MTSEPPVLSFLERFNRSYHAWNQRPDGFYERKLGLLEGGFDANARMKGVSDVFTLAKFTVPSSSTSTVLSETNLLRTWTELRILHPLLDSVTATSAPDMSTAGLPANIPPSMMPVPEDLHFVYPGPRHAAERARKTFHRIPGTIQNNVEDWVETRLLNGRRKWLQQETCLSRVFLLQLGEGEWAVCFHMAHCVSDGVSATHLLADFFRLLASPQSTTAIESEHPPSRRLTPALEDSYPPLPPSCNNWGPGRRRFWWAAQKVMYDLRTRRERSTRSIPLPTRRLLPPVAVQPISRWPVLVVGQDNVRRLVKVAREGGVSMGNLIYAIVGTTISNYVGEEAARKADACQIGFPFNIRPFLGGERSENPESSIMLSFASIVVPAIPLKKGTKGREVKEVVLARAKLVGKQFRDHFKSQERLVLNSYLRSGERLRAARGLPPAEKGKVKEGGEEQGEFSSMPLGQSMNCSVVGNLDHVLPSTYPVQSSTSSSPLVLEITALRMGVRVRSAEILGEIWRFRGELTVAVGFDESVYERTMIEGFLAEFDRVLGSVVGEQSGEDVRVRARL